ncbi:MAG: hypothetical protein MIO90_01135 [Methanomassiliicoccales archaeon]|nr:hypothetical protein [Methanomassiliicoccales archaeon]
MNDRSKKQKEAKKAKKVVKEYKRELAKLAEEAEEIREAAKNAICSECHTKCILKDDPLKPYCPKCDKFVTNFYT